jgi:hypothetical protein
MRAVRWQGRAVSDAPTDDELIAQYRNRFRRGPVGVWTTSLGAGWDICYGCQFEFRSDFTGRAVMYDSGEEQQPETETPFIWTVIDDFTIDVQPTGEVDCREGWGIIRYDFRFACSKHGGDRILVLFEKGRDATDKPGFWWSPNPVVFAGASPHDMRVRDEWRGS